MSMRIQEIQSHRFDQQAKIGDNQTIPTKEHRQRPRKAACSEAQTHSQKPFAHRETFFLRDVGTLFSSAAVRRTLLTR